MEVCVPDRNESVYLDDHIAELITGKRELAAIENDNEFELPVHGPCWNERAS